MPLENNLQKSDINLDGLMAYARNDTVVFIELKNGSPTHRDVPSGEIHGADVTAISFCRGKEFCHLLASASRDRKVKVWDTSEISEGRINCLETFEWKAEIVSIDWALKRCSDTLYVLDKKGVLIIWRINEKKHLVLNTIVNRHAILLSACPYNPYLVALGYEGGLIQIFHCKRTGQIGAILNGHHEDIISLSWPPHCPSSINKLGDWSDSLDISSTSNDGTIRVWNIQTELCLILDKPPCHKAGRSKDDYVTAIWNPSSLRNIICSSSNGLLYLMVIKTDNTVEWQKFDTLTNGKHNDSIYNVSVRESIICTFSNDQLIYLWNLDKKSSISNLPFGLQQGMPFYKYSVTREVIFLGASPSPFIRDDRYTKHDRKSLLALCASVPQLENPRYEPHILEHQWNKSSRDHRQDHANNLGESKKSNSSSWQVPERMRSKSSNWSQETIKSKNWSDSNSSSRNEKVPFVNEPQTTLTNVANLEIHSSSQNQLPVERNVSSHQVFEQESNELKCQTSLDEKLIVKEQIDAENTRKCQNSLGLNLTAENPRDRNANNETKCVSLEKEISPSKTSLDTILLLKISSRLCAEQKLIEGTLDYASQCVWKSMEARKWNVVDELIEEQRELKVIENFKLDALLLLTFFHKIMIKSFDDNSQLPIPTPLIQILVYNETTFGIWINRMFNGKNYLQFISEEWERLVPNFGAFHDDMYETIQKFYGYANDNYSNKDEIYCRFAVDLSLSLLSDSVQAKFAHFNSVFVTAYKSHEAHSTLNQICAFLGPNLFALVQTDVVIAEDLQNPLAKMAQLAKSKNTLEASSCAIFMFNLLNQLYSEVKNTRVVFMDHEYHVFNAKLSRTNVYETKCDEMDNLLENLFDIVAAGIVKQPDSDKNIVFPDLGQSFEVLQRILCEMKKRIVCPNAKLAILRIESKIAILHIESKIAILHIESKIDASTMPS